MQLGRAARSNVAGDHGALTSMSAMEGTADAATGNSGNGNISTDDVQYPAKFDSVIAVSAIDSNRARRHGHICFIFT